MIAAEPARGREIIKSIMPKQEGVKVLVRVRPPNEHEASNPPCVFTNERAVTIECQNDERKKNRRTFGFNSVLGANASQHDVFDEVEGVVDGVIEVLPPVCKHAVSSLLFLLSTIFPACRVVSNCSNLPCMP